MDSVDWSGVLQTAAASAVQAGLDQVLNPPNPDTVPIPAPVNTGITQAAQTQENLPDPNKRINNYLIYGGVGLVVIVLLIIVLKR